MNIAYKSGVAYASVKADVLKEILAACRDALFALENPNIVGVKVRLKEQLRGVIIKIEEG